ncbi:YxiJ family protein [Neobacillus drentensis]|uniref:YxiJ family protein n=1 Tax=Neobacillus drentensis TaxID=220684 RepID=UPI002855D077|nr:YxiJ family protein [Neobacillus drentensis]MDR7240851.1 hypothetical protein [Neobacillus drentensis]
MSIYDELKAIKESLEKPFPYGDIYKIQEDFNKELSEDDTLTADLNTYWMNIAGSLSYVLKGIPNKIPQGQIDWLQLSFIDIFQKYRFFEEKIADYPSFYEVYLNYEKARKILLDYLSYN